MPIPRSDYKYILDNVKDLYKKKYKKLMDIKTFLKVSSPYLVEIIHDCYKQNRR